MPTSSNVRSHNEVKLCDYCEHLFQKSFCIGCDLDIWIDKYEVEVFFYNPSKYYYELSRNREEFIQNSIMCKDYKGPKLILTNMTASCHPEAHYTIDGEKLITKSSVEYELVMRKLTDPETITRTIKFISGDGGIFEEWTKNIIL